ncbi:hypothetical protein [Lysobacter humi (ex Lee et al. 2017)]
MARTLLPACLALTCLLAACTAPAPPAAPAAAIAPGPAAPAPVAPAPVAVHTHAEADATPAAAPSGGQWFEGRADGAPFAAWGAPASEAVLRLECDDDAGRIVLTREAHALPGDVRILTLEADGVRMDFPAERVATTLGADLVTRIALDAPALDRLLATPRLAVITGDETLHVDAPGRALRPVLDACRARH